MENNITSLCDQFNNICDRLVNRNDAIRRLFASSMSDEEYGEWASLRLDQSFAEFDKATGHDSGTVPDPIALAEAYARALLRMDASGLIIGRLVPPAFQEPTIQGEIARRNLPALAKISTLSGGR